MLSLSYSHFDPKVFAFAVLYSNVTNSAAIRDAIITASKGSDEDRKRVDYAFIDAQLITSTQHLSTAIHQALLAKQQLVTKTVHSEILWVLNPTNNISEAIRRYGVSPATTSLVVVKITEDEEWIDTLDELVSGQRTEWDNLGSLTDWERIKKIYKLPNDMDNHSVDTIVASSVAIKSVI